jgi:HNH endonuclease
MVGYARKTATGTILIRRGADAGRGARMFSRRYGDLRKIAAHTDGDCHLCLEPVDLVFYGRTGVFGADTVTIDHVEPQSHGGSDELDNLRVAHGTCNSRRGTGEVELARLLLSGTIETPRSAKAKMAVSMAGATPLALGAGCLCARPNSDGTRQFNSNAALLTWVLGATLLRLML